MGVGYMEMMETPHHIIMRDLEMMALEVEYSTPKENK